MRVLKQKFIFFSMFSTWKGKLQNLIISRKTPIGRMAQSTNCFTNQVKPYIVYTWKGKLPKVMIS